MVVLIVIGGIILVALLTLAVSYNRFVRQRNLVAESWSQVDVELQRRHDLIPNLVDVVKGYAAHEAQTLLGVTNARAAAEQLRTDAAGDRSRRADAENQLTRALTGLVAVAENYPDLKASQNFLQLQQQLVTTEDRLAAGRRFYNANVRAINTRVESFPSALVATWFHFAKADYFPLDDPAARASVTVDLAPETSKSIDS